MNTMTATMLSVEEQPSELPPPRRNPLYGYLALAAAAIIALGAAGYLFLSGDDEPETPAFPDLSGFPNPYPDTGPLEPSRPETGQPAPDFALVDARDPSKVVKLSDFRGKAVVLNWYASWCDPCKKEIPAFIAAEQALNGELVILGVNFLEPRDKAVSILDDLGATYPAVLDGGGEVAEHYRVTGMPTTFFIDKEGILRVQSRGEVTVERLVENLGKAGVTYEPK